eukprot:CAMPEP_0184490542 /NCGR_PEP_ID=MMETSP0113_2-20130426/18104_1 /TAXON_ID=91329 /ORGANISM="Norrisiella sphaerica, Strain BC52" /LENGTH=200 /DNA_ID=CAMNT_0026874459 /DNA_START=1138 /DNA_END=1741 /DNA_ORIENTATION=-
MLQYNFDDSGVGAATGVCDGGERNVDSIEAGRVCMIDGSEGRGSSSLRVSGWGTDCVDTQSDSERRMDVERGVRTTSGSGCVASRSAAKICLFRISSASFEATNAHIAKSRVYMSGALTSAAARKHLFSAHLKGLEAEAGSPEDAEKLRVPPAPLMGDQLGAFDVDVSMHEAAASTHQRRAHKLKKWQGEMTLLCPIPKI